MAAVESIPSENNSLSILYNKVPITTYCFSFWFYIYGNNVPQLWAGMGNGSAIEILRANHHSRNSDEEEYFYNYKTFDAGENNGNGSFSMLFFRNNSEGDFWHHTKLTLALEDADYLMVCCWINLLWSKNNVDGIRKYLLTPRSSMIVLYRKKD